MHLTEYFQKYKPLITSHLQTYFDKKKKKALKNDLFYLDVIKKLETFTIGGKMIRGGLVLLCYEMNGGKIDEKVLNAAAAVELVHSGLCIHDDIMDNDTLRRGRPTIFSQYQDTIKKSGPMYAQSMAICVGDIVYFMAMELLSNITDNLELQKKLLHFCMDEFMIVGTSQMMDVFFAQPEQIPTTDQAIYVYAHKTGRYGFTVPITLGESLAKNDANYTSPLDSFSEKLGTIFQIKDDELGLLGDEKTIGKSVGSDIRENKKTLIYLVLYQAVNDEEKRYLDSCFGNPDLSSEDIKKIKSLVEKYSIFKTIDAEIEKLHGDLIHVLETAHIDDSYKKILHELIEFNLKRTK
jgi:geranylgeranyl diphosphate synthase type I